MGKIEDKVHLSPAEAEIGAKLGNTFNTFSPGQVRSTYALMDNVC